MKVKQYKCKIDHYLFALSDEIKIHKRIHIKVRLYKCIVFDQFFLLPDNVKFSDNTHRFKNEAILDPPVHSNNSKTLNPNKTYCRII